MPKHRVPNVTVIGSINIDYVATVDELPRRGETIMATNFEQHLGGKGANQAVAAALLGADVALVGCVGDDEAGSRALAGLAQAGVDTSRVRTVAQTPTGTAFITVGSTGENTIVVVPGANDRLSVHDVETVATEQADCSAVVLQLEVPDDVIKAFVQQIDAMRRSAGIHEGDDAPPLSQSAATVPETMVTSTKPWIVFNPSPFRPSGLLPRGTVDVLLVNEVEATAMSGHAVENVTDAGRAARALTSYVRTGGCVVITLGGQGVVALPHDARGQTAPLHVPALPVQAVDTTGAGDVFTGGLIARLTAGHSIGDALRFATAAASVAVTRAGAQSSFPRSEEVEALLRRVEPARPLTV